MMCMIHLKFSILKILASENYFEIYALCNELNNILTKTWHNTCSLDSIYLSEGFNIDISATFPLFMKMEVVSI